MKMKLLQACLKQAREKKHPGQNWEKRHFSFVIQDGDIIAMGMNRVGTPIPGFGYGNSYPQNIHAEPDAFRRARSMLDLSSPWEIFNVRLNKRDEIRMSAPCGCCTSFLITMGCKRAYFTTAVGFASVNLR